MALDDESKTCAICHETLRLENCVIDEQGHAVHKSCYLRAVTKAKRTTYDETEELLQQARELREIADRLIKKSDALLTAYNKLTGHSKSPKVDRAQD